MTWIRIIQKHMKLTKLHTGGPLGPGNPTGPWGPWGP